MFNLFKKKQLKFYSSIAGLEKLHPILPAKEFAHLFFCKAKQQVLSPQTRMKTAKCSGIRALFQQGFIQTTWVDIKITSNEDGSNFACETAIPVEIAQTPPYNRPVAVLHDSMQYAEFMGMQPDTGKCLLKIISPWTVQVPKGYYLIQTNVNHIGENRFTTATGVIEGGMCVELSSQLFWHMLGQETVIKAGTPIAHMFLVKEEEYTPECVAMTAEEARRMFNIQGFKQRRFSSQPMKIAEEDSKVMG
jgi:hypothetical protein